MKNIYEWLLIFHAAIHDCYMGRDFGAKDCPNNERKDQS